MARQEVGLETARYPPARARHACHCVYATRPEVVRRRSAGPDRATPKGAKEHAAAGYEVGYECPLVQALADRGGRAAADVRWQFAQLTHMAWRSVSHYDDPLVPEVFRGDLLRGDYPVEGIVAGLAS